MSQTCVKRVTHTVVCGEPATHRLGKHGMWHIGDGALCEQHAHLARLAGYDTIRLVSELTAKSAN